MKPRITFITLGVDDLERAVAFYRDGLGLPTDGIVGQEFDYGAVAFFELSGGLKLALWPRSSIARDAGVALQPPAVTEVTLANNVNSKAEVDAVMQEVRRVGGKVVKPPADTFYGGYAGYFEDLDGHLWEVAWNPDITVSDD
jgi:predicted lactoylglutathione lyase